MTKATIKTTRTPKLVLVAEGESNGRDDSDGFDMYVDLDTYEVIEDHWTTRFGCDKSQRPHCTWKDLTAEQSANVRKALEKKALEIIEQKCKEMNYLSSISKYVVECCDYKEVPVIVRKGNKFRGFGHLVRVESFEYGYGYYGQRAVSYRAIIETDDDETHVANLENVEVVLGMIDMSILAKAQTFDILQDAAFDGNIVRYSEPLSIGSRIMRLMRA